MRVHGNNLQNLISVQALLNRQLKHNISLVMEKSVFSKKASTQRKFTIKAAPDAAEGRYALQFTHSALPQNNLTKGSFDVKKAEIHSIQVKNSSIKGGAEIEGTVTLKNPAPAGGIKVKITGVSNQLVKSPTFPLTMPQGKKSTSFKAPTKPVATQTKAWSAKLTSKESCPRWPALEKEDTAEMAVRLSWPPGVRRRPSGATRRATS